MITTERLLEMYKTAETAVAELAVGDTFVGAFGEAEKDGLVKGTHEYDLYVTLWIVAFEARDVYLYTDNDGVITSIVPKHPTY